MGKLAFMFVLFAFPLSALAEEPTAEGLAAICTYESKPENMRELLQASCMSFVRGFMAYHTAVAASVPGFQLFCLPKEGEILNVLRMAFVAESRKFRDEPNAPAGMVMLSAMMGTYPCPTK